CNSQKQIKKKAKAGSIGGQNSRFHESFCHNDPPPSPFPFAMLSRPIRSFYKKTGSPLGIPVLRHEAQALDAPNAVAGIFISPDRKP
ncbi:MAG: hypothetical protein ABFC75_05650, partial [Rectinema sp.]